MKDALHAFIEGVTMLPEKIRALIGGAVGLYSGVIETGDQTFINNPDFYYPSWIDFTVEFLMVMLWGAAGALGASLFNYLLKEFQKRLFTKR